MLIPTISTDREEQLRLAHKVVDVADRANRKICVTSYAELQLFAWKKEDEKYQKIVYVKNNLEEFIYLLDVKNSVYDNFIAIKPHL